MAKIVSKIQVLKFSLYTYLDLYLYSHTVLLTNIEIFKKYHFIFFCVNVFYLQMVNIRYAISCITCSRASTRGCKYLIVATSYQNRRDMSRLVRYSPQTVFTFHCFKSMVIIREWIFMRLQILIFILMDFLSVVSTDTNSYKVFKIF